MTTKVIIKDHTTPEICCYITLGNRIIRKSARTLSRKKADNLNVRCDSNCDMNSKDLDSLI